MAFAFPYLIRKHTSFYKSVFSVVAVSTVTCCTSQQVTVNSSVQSVIFVHTKQNVTCCNKMSSECLVRVVRGRSLVVANDSRLRLKCDGARAEIRFRLSAKRTSPI